jgi:hypothetical protein
VNPGPPPQQVLVSARRTARRAQLLALAALAVALIAIITSIVALARGPGERSALSPATTSTAPRSTESASERSTQPSSRTGEPTVETSVIDTRRVTPDADFQVVYEGQELRVQPMGSCDEQRYVDVDEPRVGATRETAEFSYGKDCSGGVKAKIDVADGLPVSLVTSESATAKDCAEAIRNGPVNEPLVPSDQTRLCLVTSAEDAQSQGTSQKVALIVVTGILQDGTMNIQVTTWSVPR